jgi:hypothetical protein
MINFKQRELSNRLFEQLHARFPEIELAKITESYETPEDIWLHIIMPEDEERAMEMREIAAEISTDMLITYGYHITIVSALPSEKVAV